MTTDLRQRLIDSTGPDRELACDILDHFNICPHRKLEHYSVQGDSGYECVKCGKDATYNDTPKLTASVDACIALMQEKLPLWMLDVRYFGDPYQLEVSLCRSDGTHSIEVKHPLLTHAILLSVLDAVEAGNG